MIDNLFVFDFDDTLAKTIAHIGVARILPQGEDDTLFPMWLENNDLHYEFKKEGNDGTFYYLPSEIFATYQKIAASDELGETKDIFDFAETAGVDPQTTQAHQGIVQILKKAENSPNSKVIIVTARGGDNMETPFGNIEATNREDIANFLSTIGAGIDGSSIFPVGSSDPRHKAQVVKQYIERLNPADVYFYDDNELNLAAIHELCFEYQDVTNIHTIKVTDGKQAPAIPCP
jgi:hypothetical protein